MLCMKHLTQILALGKFTNNIINYCLFKSTPHFRMLSLIDALICCVNMKLDILESRELARGGRLNTTRCAKVLFPQVAMSKCKIKLFGIIGRYCKADVAWCPLFSKLLWVCVFTGKEARGQIAAGSL